MIDRRFGAAALAACLGLMGACTDGVPTASDPGLIPVEATSVEVRIPFEDFARDLRVDRGYGSVADLPIQLLAREWEGELTARPLVRFLNFPASIIIFPPGSNIGRPDSTFVAAGADLVVFFDTLAVEGEPPFEVSAGAVQEEWDPRTASWALAVDTLGGQRGWTVPGGGAVRDLGIVEWLPAEGDSVVFEVDSITANEWMDRENGARGLRLGVETPGARLRMRNLALRVRAVTSVNPDTVVAIEPAATESTLLYRPEPTFAADVLPIGGAPGHRVSFRIDLPDLVEVSGPACGEAPTCQVALTPERVVYAGLNLRSVATEPSALAPTDSLVLDIRPVLAPDRLPRSPLGFPVSPLGKLVGPDHFRGDAGVGTEIAVTRYLRDVLRREDPAGDPVPSTVSILATVEPSGLGVATFAGPGREGAPFLRIILTLSEGVKLP